MDTNNQNPPTILGSTSPKNNDPDSDNTCGNVRLSEMTASQQQIYEFELHERNNGISNSQQLEIISRYPFRSNIDRQSFSGSGRVDCDETGDYDPAAEEKRERAARANRLRKRKVYNGHKEGDGRSPRSEAAKSPGIEQGNEQGNKQGRIQQDTTRQQKKSNTTPKLKERSSAAPSTSRSSRLLAHAASHASVSKTILTSFCHPIQFNSSEDLANCHFCSDRYSTEGLRYSIWGLGEERRIEVVEVEDREGYNEVLSGGEFSFEGNEATRMCQACTWARMSITCCAGHNIRQIAGPDDKTYDYEAAWDRLLYLGYKGKIYGQPITPEKQEELVSQAGKRQPDNWCHICPNIAFYECCTSPAISPTGEYIPDDHDGGCGLMLCQLCAHRLIKAPLSSIVVEGRKVYLDGKRRGVNAVRTLEDIIRYAKDDPLNNYQMGLRADVSFLLQDGELMERLNKAPRVAPEIIDLTGSDDEV